MNLHYLTYLDLTYLQQRSVDNTRCTHSLFVTYIFWQLTNKCYKKQMTIISRNIINFVSIRNFTKSL